MKISQVILEKFLAERTIRPFWVLQSRPLGGMKEVGI